MFIWCRLVAIYIQSSKRYEICKFCLFSISPRTDKSKLHIYEICFNLIDQSKITNCTFSAEVVGLLVHVSFVTLLLQYKEQCYELSDNLPAAGSMLEQKR